MKLPRFLRVLGIVVIIGAAFKGGVYVGAHEVPAIEKVTSLSGKVPDGGTPVDFSPFWKAWNIINEKYVSNGSTSTPEKTVDQDKVYGAIQGLTKSLGDPYTVFFNPEQEKLFETEISGKFEGVGMEVGIKDGVLTVIAPLKGTPAERAGVRSGDKIVKIDDKETGDMSVDQAVRLIRGPGGTTVRLTFFRDKEGLLPEITITRSTINVPVADEKEFIVLPKPSRSGVGKGGATGTSTAAAQKHPEARTREEKANGVYVIKLFNFGETSFDAFKDKIQNFFNTGSNKLIIDLRGNPGGYLGHSIDIASMFLPKGAVIVRENFGTNGGELIHRSQGYGALPKLPKIVILVDRGSASASEILASALKENGVAVLVGEKTFGKGSVQQLVQLTPETSLKITVARWYTPNGESLSNGGLKPDYEVIPTKEDIAAGRDVQFDKAVEILTK